MAWLFYLLSGLLLIWAFFAVTLVVYSIWASSRRLSRSALRSRLHEAIRSVVTEAGGYESIDSGRLLEMLRQQAGKDLISIRDSLVECAEKLDGEALKPIFSIYESFGFAAQDMRTIQQGRWQGKIEAAIRLGHMRCWSAIEVLTGALRDKDDEVRLAAVCALAEIGDPHSVSAIVYSLSGANGWQALQVADKLLHMRVDLTKLLIDLLAASGAIRTKREAVTKTVLDLIADFGHRNSERINARAARVAASQFLNSDSIDMRARAIRAIAAVGIENDEELNLLLEKLNDTEWEIRAVASKALGQLDKREAIPALTKALTDEAWWVRHNSAHALALLGKNGMDALRAQTLNPDRFARDIARQVIEELQLDAATRSEIR